MSEIIEFMGLPGSGKSTLARALLADVPELRCSDAVLIQYYKQRQRGLARAAISVMPPTFWRHRVAAQEATSALHMFCCAYPELMAVMFDVVARACLRPEWRSCVLYAMLKRIGEHHMIATNSDTLNVAVVEEGLALGLITVMGCLPIDCHCEVDIAAYVENMPHLSGIVYVKADIAQCARRLQHRAELPLLWAGSSQADLEAQLSFRQSVLDYAVPLLEARGVSVCTVDNNDGAFESVRMAVHQYAASGMPMKSNSGRA